MNHKKPGRTLVLAAAVAMLAMGLQGCGGDDGISQSRLDEEIAKTAAAEKARMEAEAAKAKADKDKMAAEAATAAADKATMEAKAATAAANQAKMEAEAATAAAENSPENARLKKAVEEARAEVKRLTEEADKRVADAKKAEAHATAENLLAAMATAQGRLFPSAGNPMPLAQTNNLNNPAMLKLTSSTLKAEFPSYRQAMERPREIGGGGVWSGVRLTSNTDPNDEIVVYSNQPAKKVFFRDRYARKIVPGQPAGYATTRDGSGSTLKMVTGAGSDLFHDTTACPFANDPARGLCNRNYYDVGYGGTGSYGSLYLGSIRQNYVTTSSLSTIRNVSGPGGIKGKLTCPGGQGSGLPCETRDSSTVQPRVRSVGVSYLVNPTHWTFIPDPDYANHGFHEPYVYFGWWMNEAPPDGSEAFGVFYNAVDPVYGIVLPNSGYVSPNPARQATKRTAGNTSGGTLTGSATYEGGAAGRYAIRALGAENGSRSGDFVADVTLNVDFDVDKTPAVAGNDREGIALSGVINNFRADYEGSNEWVVTLSADRDTTAAGAQPLESFYDTATNIAYETEWRALGGSVPIGTGQWKVDFYSGADSVAPDLAGGMFWSGIQNVSHLMGAFGATRKTSGQ